MQNRGPRRLLGFGVLAALWAVVAQLSFGAFVPASSPLDRLFATLDSPAAFCTASHAPTEAPSRLHELAELAVCPLNVNLVRPSPVLAVFSPLPRPFPRLVARFFQRPAGRGPPEPDASEGPPRGPPVKS